MPGKLPTGTSDGAWAGDAGVEAPGEGAAGGVVLLHEASTSPSTTADSTGHNAGFGSRLPRNQHMWVIYLNVAIAVALVAFFVVWTMRGRK